MKPLSNQELAQLIWLVSVAEDQCKAAVVGVNRPAITLPDGFTVVGFITGDDHGVIEAQEVFFGYLATDGTRFYLVIRGTEHFLEWVEDAEFGFVDHPYGGKVEVGFWLAYSSLRYEGMPIVSALAALPGINTQPITVIGHSLGGPLAAYLAIDLAKAGLVVNCRAFACPKPGDVAFSAMFSNLISDHLVTNYELDLVPTLPPDRDFVSAGKVNIITRTNAAAKIKFSLACNHSSVSYSAMLDYALSDWKAYSCVKGSR